MEYEAMLERAHTNMPASVLEKERFEIPKVNGHHEGNKTIISNFNQIALALRRPPEHMLKYLLKELATPGDFRRGLLIMGSRLKASRINQKVREYAEEFVFCPACGKPDTDIKMDGQLNVMSCSVCGNRQVVKKI